MNDSGKLFGDSKKRSTFVRQEHSGSAGKKVLAGTTAALLGFGTIALAGSPAYAFPGYSAASAQYLSGSLLELSLEDIAELEGVSAEAPYGSDATVVEGSNLNLNVLGDVLTLEVADGVEIPLTLTDAGVVGQYAEASPSGDSRSASGAVTEDGAVDVDPDPANPPGPLTLDLTDLIEAEVAGEVEGLSLVVGANTATADQDAGEDAVGDYNIADLTLVLDSPTVAALSGTISDTAAPLETTVDSILGPDGSVITSLTGLLSGTGAVTADVSLDVDLTTAVDGVLAENTVLGADGPVVVNLTDGTITVDVAALLAANGTDLNELPANTELLNTALAGFITAEVDDLVNGLLTTVDETVTETLNAAVLNLDVLVGDEADPLLSVEVTGPLSEIASGEIVGEVIIGDEETIVADLVNTTLAGVVGGVLDLEVDTEAVDAALDGVDGLYPALDDVLTGVASLTANVQETSADGVFTETALRLGVLNFTDADGEALLLNLAQASVGPNALVADPENPDTIIVGFTPTEGPEVGGTEVTITGTGFTGATNVLFGATPATDFEVVSDTEITAISPAGTGDVALTVTGTQYGDAVSPGLFSYIPDDGTTVAVATIDPDEGPEAGGTEVTITGVGFTGADEVLFGTNPATEFVVVSDTEITAVTPAGVGSVPVTIEGTDNGDVTSDVDFTYIPDDGDGAVVTTISPAEGPEAGGTNVTIVGDGFTGTTGVLFGANPATNVTVVSDTVITATSPAGVGTVPVTLAGVDVDSDVDFTYIPEDGDDSVVTTITPNTGPEAGGTNVTIVGDGFTGADEVLFGDTPATNVTVVSDTVITATSPAGTGVVLVNIEGTAVPVASDVTFTYVAAAPSIDSFTPGTGPENGGTTVTIIGDNLGDVTEVLFGDTPGEIVSVSDTQVVVTSPAGTGDVLITVIGADGQGATSDETFEYVAAAPGDGDGGGPIDGSGDGDGTGTGGDGDGTGSGNGSPYANCTEAAAAGATNIPSSSPNYDSSLDRDGDGIGCESDELASTGANTVNGMVTLGAISFLLGGGLLLFRRRFGF